ncbi:MAG: hypothetical protein HC925_08795 [Coleofasciculaceae cyanobacterium SM2_3_26]|nr:hypothetical protein [Coleofasciculaceae cyanobacterium SM2_3_26]
MAHLVAEPVAKLYQNNDLENCKREYQNMLSWLLSLGVALVPVSGEAIAPLLPTPAEVPLAQTLPTVSDDLDLGKQLLEELLGCVRQTTLELSQPSITQLEAASTQCVLDVILLGENGRVRPDASDRLVALMQTMGVRLPQPVSKGQATHSPRNDCPKVKCLPCPSLSQVNLGNFTRHGRVQLHSQQPSSPGSRLAGHLAIQ